MLIQNPRVEKFCRWLDVKGSSRSGASFRSERRAFTAASGAWAAHSSCRSEQSGPAKSLVDLDAPDLVEVANRSGPDTTSDSPKTSAAEERWLRLLFARAAEHEMGPHARGKGYIAYAPSASLRSPYNKHELTQPRNHNYSEEIEGSRVLWVKKVQSPEM